ncbi:hypothetical protein ACLI4Q_17350 [Natrialbaceae archaeon A-CW1-1]
MRDRLHGRRPYLASVGGVACAGLGTVFLAGCLSRREIGDQESGTDSVPLFPDSDWPDDTVADRTFERSALPICAERSEIAGDAETIADVNIADHGFFHDPDTGRYGVRGRIQFERALSTPTIRVEFLEGSTVLERASRTLFRPSEDAIFTITGDGNPDRIDGYRLIPPDGDDSGPGPEINDGLEVRETAWGIIGEADGESVYGGLVTVENVSGEHPAGQKPRNALVYARSLYENGTTAQTHHKYASPKLEPGETHTFSLPYRWCDPGRVVGLEVRPFLLRD